MLSLDDVRLETGTKSRGTVNSNECGWTVTPESALAIHDDALHYLYDFGLFFPTFTYKQTL